MTSSAQPRNEFVIAGRERERERLRAILDRARAGSGALALISGDAGIGKTTMVRELARHARERGMLVLQGACYDLMTTPPYGPWIEALQGYQPAAGQPPAPAWLADPAELEKLDSQAALFEDARRFFSAVAELQPLVIILEDLHWSDPASLEALRYLSRYWRDLPILVAASFRVDEAGRQLPINRLLPVLVREARAERFELRPLTGEEVRGLIGRRYALDADDEGRLVSYLESRAEGNPFYVTELLHMLETERILQSTQDGWTLGNVELTPVPPLIRQVIEGRLAGFDSEVRNLLDIAAVIGQQVSLDLWQGVTDAGDEQLVQALEQAVEAHLMLELPETTSISFAHSLVRETLYDGLSLARRRLLHRRVAEVLADRPEPPLNLVASHFDRAGDPRAVDWLVRAGERALALYAAHDAIAALNRAHELAVRFSRELPARAYRARAAAQTILGDFDRARRDYEHVLERSRASKDRQTEWQTLLDLGLLWAGRDYERTGGYYQAALDLARKIGDGPEIAYSLNRVGNWHVNLERPDVALPLHREALRLFDESGDRDGIADSLDLLALASYLSCDFSTSADYGERVIALFRDLNDRQRLSSSLANHTLLGGDPTCVTAVPVFREETYWTAPGEESLAIAREIGWTAGEAFAHTALGMSRSVRGRFTEALRDAEAGLEIALQIGHRQWTVATRCVVGMIWMDLLHPERAATELEQGLTDARVSGSQLWISTLAATLTSLRIAETDLDQATAILESVALPDRPGASMGQRQCWFALAELMLARDEAERSLDMADQLLDTAPPSPAGHGIPQVLKLRGDALTRLGRHEEADQAYQAARDNAAIFGYLPVLWRVDAARGDLYRAMGRAKDAEQVSRQARDTIERLAGDITDEPVRERFRERALAFVTFERPVRRGPETTGGLTPRELDVLKLLTEGRTDREIAEVLSISPRTVMRHVTSILSKLDVPSRTAAAARALREGLI